MNILAEFKKLKDAVSALVADQSKATVASITDLSSKIASIETGALAELESVRQQVASLGNEKAGLEASNADLTAKLSEANRLQLDAADAIRAHLATLPGHADYKPDGKHAKATLPELIEAEKNATNTAIAATGIKADALPAGGTPPPAANNKPKNLTEACLAAKKIAK